MKIKAKKDGKKHMIQDATRPFRMLWGNARNISSPLIAS